jgi:anti-sigma B factor antagonist
MRTPFSLNVRLDHGSARLELGGELDVLTTRQVRDRVFELTGAGFATIVLDLRGLTFIDSTGMRLLVGLHHHARRDGWRLYLIQGPENVKRVFDIAGTSQVLPFTTAAAALPDGQLAGGS